MAKLRNTWERVYHQALEILRKNKHPIAVYTVNIIEKKKVEIIPYNKMVAKDLNDYLSDYHDEKNERLPSSYPPTKEVVGKFRKAWSAKINYNRISIDHAISDPRKLAKVLVHEANHFLNDSNEHYETKQQQFDEEFRAYVAEELVFSRQIRNCKLRALANNVADRYKLPRPKSVEMPKGLFVPRPKR